MDSKHPKTPNTLAMWTRDNKYCMVNGEYMITKYHVRDKTIYVLRKCAHEIGHFDSYANALAHYDSIKDKHD
jgi:hypothetical protein